MHRTNPNAQRRKGATRHQNINNLTDAYWCIAKKRINNPANLSDASIVQHYFIRGYQWGLCLYVPFEKAYLLNISILNN